MKKILIVGALLASAQLALAGPMMGKRFDPPSVEKRVERMTEALSLSDEQAQNVTTIMTNYDEQRKPLMEQLKQLRDAERKEIGAVLTDEQKEKLADMRDRRPPHF